jgi:hypothetical protein
MRESLRDIAWEKTYLKSENLYIGSEAIDDYNLRRRE